MDLYFSLDVCVLSKVTSLLTLEPKYLIVFSSFWRPCIFASVWFHFLNFFKKIVFQWQPLFCLLPYYTAKTTTCCWIEKLHSYSTEKCQPKTFIGLAVFIVHIASLSFPLKRHWGLDRWLSSKRLRLRSLLQFQDMQHTLLTSSGTTHTWCANTCADKTLIHVNKNKMNIKT